MAHANQHPPVTEEDLAKWSEALDDGMGYKHVSEVYGVARSTLMRYLPGRGWTRKQISEHAALMRKHNRTLASSALVLS